MRNLPLDQIQIPHPCTQDWAAMRGNDQRRFCTICQKHVHNLAALPREQADAVARQDHACVRLARAPEGRVLTSEDFPLARVRSLLNRRGLRGFSRLILLIAPILLASCRRATVAMMGTPMPPISPEMQVMGAVSSQDAPATATQPAPEEPSQQPDLILPDNTGADNPFESPLPHPCRRP